MDRTTILDGRQAPALPDRVEDNGRPKGKASKQRIGEPVLLRLSDVEPEPIEWVWPGRIAIGKLTLFAGDPGIGKSLITSDIAARVSKGLPWPDTPEAPEPGSVIMLSAEDDPADTIRPRLDAAGADVSKVHLLQAVSTINESDGTRIERTFSLERDVAALGEVLASMPDARMVTIDPISAYLGKTDSHKNADIRGLLAPLAELAQRFRVAMVVITHLNKSAGPPMYRSMGSLAFVAAARMVWAVAKDPKDAANRLMLPVKCNIAKDSTGLSYRIVEVNGAPCLAWSPDPIDVAVDDVLAAGAEKKDTKGQQAIDEAADFLRQVLADGPVASKLIKAEASTNGGPSWATIRRAQVELGIVPKPDRFGKGAIWMWALPDPPEVRSCSPETVVAQSKDVGNYDESEHLQTNGGEVGLPPEEREAYRDFMGDADDINRLMMEAAEADSDYSGGAA